MKHTLKPTAQPQFSTVHPATQYFRFVISLHLKWFTYKFKISPNNFQVTMI